jgi:hypothetical protein
MQVSIPIDKTAGNSLRDMAQPFRLFDVEMGEGYHIRNQPADEWARAAFRRVWRRMKVSTSEFEKTKPSSVGL